MIIGHTICTLNAIKPVDNISIIANMEIDDFLESFRVISVGHILNQKSVGMSHT